MWCPVGGTTVSETVTTSVTTLTVVAVLCIIIESLSCTPKIQYCVSVIPQSKNGDVIF